MKILIKSQRVLKKSEKTKSIPNVVCDAIPLSQKTNKLHEYHQKFLQNLD